MEPTALQGIESMLAQMREVKRSAAELSGTAEAPQGMGGASFAHELGRSLQRVSDAQNNAAAQAHAFQAGEPGVSLPEVMMELQKANLAFQATLQVRNRLVAAYQEIASMPV